MPVLIDLPRWPAHGRLWSHLVSDTSLPELHAFARSAGLPPRSFEGDHYDVPAERYDSLVAAGARPVTGRELVRALQASGLRLPKRKGERVLASILSTDGRLDRTHRLDLLASPLEAPATRTTWSGALVLAGDGADPAVLLVRTDDGWSLPGVGLHDGESAGAGASRALAEQTGLRLPASALRPCGHQRDMPVRPLDGRSAAPTPRDGAPRTTWRTVELARMLRPAPVDRADADWLAADRARRLIADGPWGPLVAWVVDTGGR